MQVEMLGVGDLIAMEPQEEPRWLFLGWAALEEIVDLFPLARQVVEQEHHELGVLAWRVFWSIRTCNVYWLNDQEGCVHLVSRTRDATG